MADRDPEAIKKDIEVARDQLASTVDAFVDRAHPRRIADDLKNSVVEFVKKPPVTFTLIGVGTLVAVVFITRKVRG